MLSHLSICIRVWWPLKVPHPLTTHRICIQQGPVWYQVCLRCFSRQKNPKLLKHLQRVYCKWLNPMLLYCGPIFGYFGFFTLKHSERIPMINHLSNSKVIGKWWLVTLCSPSSSSPSQHQHQLHQHHHHHHPPKHCSIDPKVQSNCNAKSHRFPSWQALMPML